MTTTTSNWQALADRVEKLERQNRRLKQAGVVVLVLVAAGLLMGQASPTRTVEANEFVLKDVNGKIRARLGVGDGPQFLLFDSAGTGSGLFLVAPRQVDCMS